MFIKMQKRESYNIALERFVAINIKLLHQSKATDRFDEKLIFFWYSSATERKGSRHNLYLIQLLAPRSHLFRVNVIPSV